MSDDLFVNRRMNLHGEIKNLVWPKKDINCMGIILKDWQRNGYAYTTIPQQYRVAVQAGGNCGLYPHLLARHFQKVFTFEPDPINFHCLTRNCMNENIVKFNTALSDEEGFVSMGNPDPTNVGMTRIGDGKISAYALTLDSLCIENVDLIQWDLEGHEYNALLGAAKTIKRCKPVIALEMGGDTELIYEYMNSIGYTESLKVNMDSIFVPKRKKK